MYVVQLEMALAALGWGVRDLAEKAGTSPDTVARFKRGEALKPSTVAKLKATLEQAGIDFIPPNGGGPGVRLRSADGVV